MNGIGSNIGIVAKATGSPSVMNWSPASVSLFDAYHKLLIHTYPAATNTAIQWKACISVEALMTEK